MKKRNLRPQTGKNKAALRRLRLENLEDRRLLASDIILGPGNAGNRVEVRADLRIDELENKDDPRANRILNNSFEQAEAIPLGFGPGQSAAIDIRGEIIEPNSLGVGNSSEVMIQGVPRLEDSSIFLANRVNFSVGTPIRFSGAFGDSVSGFNQNMPQIGGDGDFYEFEEVDAGEVITGHLDSNVNSVLVLYSAFGEVLAVSDTTNTAPGTIGFDSFVSYEVPEDGDYYFAALPYSGDLENFELPLNPYDPATIQGGPNGNYTLTMGVSAVDVDFYEFDLSPGDIVGVKSLGAANILTLHGPERQLLLQSGQDQSYLYPPSSPLPVNNGTASLAYVIDTPGTYFLSATGYNWSRYLLETRLFRPAVESAPEGTQQILFLDFDGALLNPEVFGTAAGDSLRRISPMRNFLGNWGLRDESDLIDRIISVVNENFNQDMKTVNSAAGITILNSRDHADPFGQPYVSRVIIGGTTTESTIDVAGIATSVDPGNFDMEETAIIMLDGLSGPAFSTDVGNAASLNHYPVAPGALKADLVATGVGNIVSHEAAHFFGAFHTETYNSVANIIDQGDPENFSLDYGVGDDLIWGTYDDVDVDFTEDAFSLAEGRVGVQNTLAMLANVLVTGRGADASGRGIEFSGTVYDDDNGNGFRDAGERAIAGARIYVDMNNDLEFGIGEPTGLTDSSGQYVIPDVALHNFSVRVVVPPGDELITPPSGGHTVTTGDALVEDLDFGLRVSSGPGAGTDFGDAPSSYGTASHQILSGLSLGAFVDGEAGTLDDDGSDDDGVLLSALVAGESATATVTATIGANSPGVVNGWVDFDQNGSFSGSERIIEDQLVSGTSSFSFPVPSTAAAGTTWARFRYSYQRGIGPTGNASVGEVEDYSVNITTDDDVTGPDAINDEFVATQGDADVNLAVLGNDIPGSGTLVVESVGEPDRGGTADPASDGQSIVYSPAPGFFGTETFSYTASTVFGSDTAVVSVEVQPTGTGEDDLVRLRLEVVDVNGELISTVPVGEEFTLNVYTQDLREGGIGVFAAYLDVEFDPDLATPVGSVTFGDSYPAGQVPRTGQVGDGTTGLLDEFGAFAGVSNQLGNQEVLLFSVPMVAGGEGSLTISSNQADVVPNHEVLLGDLGEAIPADRIDFTSATLDVVSTDVAAFTNPRNPLDVNNDGFVSPRDVLAGLNEINANGPRSLMTASSPIAGSLYLDVDGDMFFSAGDILLIINYINSQSAAASSVREAAVAAAVDTIFDGEGKSNDEDIFAALNV